MKKNRMMRLASVLLVLTLLSTSVISGTFAKYVTSDTVSDTARVAKFGVVVTGSGSLFGKTYINEAGGNTPSNTTGALTVASTSDDVVAPGTESAANGLALSVTGEPEVSTELKATAGNNSDIYLAYGSYGVMVNVTDQVTAENFTTDLYTSTDAITFTKATATYDNRAEYYKLKDTVTIADAGISDEVNEIDRFNDTDGKYYPIVWNVSGTNFGKVNDVVGVFTALAHTYPANTNLTHEFGTKNITWEWPFAATALDETTKNAVDGADTILGDMIAQANGASEYYVVYLDSGATYEAVKYNPGKDKALKQDGTEIACLKTNFEVTITVTQVD